MITGLTASFALLLALLTFVSYVDRLYAEIGKFLSREFQDNIDVFEHEIEPRLGVGRARAALSMSVLVPLTVAAIAMLLGFVVFKDRAWSAGEILEATLSLVLIVIIFNRFIPFVWFSRTKGEWLKRWVVPLRILIYLVLPVTLVLGFLQSVVALTKEHSGESPESQTEAVDALIEAGQEEGILDSSSRDLIQSVVEFREKTVRDAMKPRPEMVAIASNATIENLVELLKTKPVARLPVYEGTIHSVVGIVHAQDVLQIADTEASARTVSSIMRRDVYFVPESKLGSDLLREMQNSNTRMAIVVDEYGGVAGLVTIEDLVEEIVGEIRDDHEKIELIRENEHSYLAPGSMDVDRLEELFGVRPEGRESATIAGLVSELAGRIPRRGEVVESDGLRFEVLQSTERRVERVRITTVEPQRVN